MNETHSGERIRIVLLGRCNVGKSSLLNALTGEQVAIVASERGTTTDPVRRAMELLPLGAVLFCDTAGLDDESTLGKQRTARTRRELAMADVALVVAEAADFLGESEEWVISAAKSMDIPVVVALNKCDLAADSAGKKVRGIRCSAKTGEGIDELKRAIISAAREDEERKLIGDELRAGDVVILVTPIDSAAPKGRIILPQQQVLREVLDAHAAAIVLQVAELSAALAKIPAPRLVITDSQAFREVRGIVPPEVPLTSFSILFAAYKGDISQLRAGLSAVEKLKDGDRIMIAESCAHHRQDDDIGTVKIPRLLKAKTGKDLHFDFVRGADFSDAPLGDYALIVHCGGCMLNRRAMMHRLRLAAAAETPITNYGLLIGKLTGAI